MTTHRDAASPSLGPRLFSILLLFAGDLSWLCFVCCRVVEDGGWGNAGVDIKRD